MAEKKIKIEEQKCPNCGAAMRFDPIEKGIVCDHCGTTIKDKTNKSTYTESEVEGFDFKKLNEKLAVPDPENLPIYVCESCAAEIIARPEEFSLTCPYCSNNIILTDKTSGDLRPNGVIPFEITTKNIAETMQEFYKDKIFMPKDFISANKMSKITGVYVPFWVFDGKCDGTFGFTGTHTSSQREGDYVYTYTSYYDCLRGVKCDYKALPVDVSQRIGDDLMDSIQPYDMSKVKPFDISYLAGFTADRFDVAKEETEKRVEGRMSETTSDLAFYSVDREYESVSYTGGSCKAEMDAKYILFPVYLFTLDYHGSKYKFAMNGQTGKLVGNVPIDKGRKRTFWAKNTGIIAAILMAISVAAFFAGM